MIDKAVNKTVDKPAISRSITREKMSNGNANSTHENDRKAAGQEALNNIGAKLNGALGNMIPEEEEGGGNDNFYIVEFARNIARIYTKRK